jgi:hypothetical protein
MTGWTRQEAAPIGGMNRQMLRDRVMGRHAEEQRRVVQATRVSLLLAARFVSTEFFYHGPLLAQRHGVLDRLFGQRSTNVNLLLQQEFFFDNKYFFKHRHDRKIALCAGDRRPIHNTVDRDPRHRNLRGVELLSHQLVARLL